MLSRFSNIGRMACRPLLIATCVCLVVGLSVVRSAVILNRSSAPLRLLFLGDSITSCSGVSADFKSGFLSYRAALWRLAQQRGYAECIEVVGTRSGCNRRLDAHRNVTSMFPQSHDAFFGRTLRAAVDDMPNVLSVRPDVVVACLGINDALAGSKPAAMATLYNSLIAKIRRSGAVLLLLNLPPANATHKRKAVRRLAERIPAVNGVITAAVDEAQASHGSSVQLVDVLTGYDVTRMSYDGMHPNTAGEEHIASVVDSALRSALRKARRRCGMDG